jgi:hypothetical protein
LRLPSARPAPSQTAASRHSTALTLPATKVIARRGPWFSRGGCTPQGPGVRINSATAPGRAGKGEGHGGIAYRENKGTKSYVT